MTRSATRLLSLLLPLMAAAGCSSTSSGPATDDDVRATDRPTARGAGCADLIVIGARGSTQDPDLNAGVGTEVRRTVDELTRRLQERSGRTVRIEAVRYDSGPTSTVSAYQQHTAAGARMMLSRLRTLASTCPDSRFALMGFSHGAQVVHGAATDVPAPLARRVALVAMIADPRNNPADSIARWSYAREPTTGEGRLGAGPPIDADLRSAAISLCVEDDEICNARGSPGDPPSSAHRHFYEGAAAVRATAEQLDAVLRRHGV